MTPGLQQTETSLTIGRTFDAPQARVWQYFTNPAELTEWYAPHDTDVTVHKNDPRPGGRIEIELFKDGGDRSLRGEYLVVDELDKLVYTLHLGGKDTKETKITVTFRDNGHGQTEVALTQGGLAGKEVVETQSEAWAECFERLADAL